MKLGAIEICIDCVVCAVGNDSGEIMYKKSFSMSTFEDTIVMISEYFKNKHIKGLGIIVNQSTAKNLSELDWKTNLEQTLKIPIALKFNTENEYIQNDKTILSVLILARNVA